MNRRLQLLLVFIVLIFSAATVWLAIRLHSLEHEIGTLSEKTEEPALHTMMGTMQTYLHKFTYAVDNEQPELSDFYLYEMEELSHDIIRHIPEYDDHPVGELMSSMLIPILKQTEDALSDKNWESIRERKSAVVQACNHCHAATRHGYIRITEKGKYNPFNQDFSSR